MRKVGIRELKARLSAYVRKARAGEVLLVTDHGEVVAQLRQPDDSQAEPPSARRFRDAVNAGWLRLPSDPDDRSWLEADVGLRRGTAAKLLDAERGET